MAGSRESRIVRTGFAEVQREQVRRQSVVFVAPQPVCGEALKPKRTLLIQNADHANKVTGAVRSEVHHSNKARKTQHGHRGVPALIMYRGPMSETAGASLLSRRCRNAEKSPVFYRKAGSSA